MVDSDCEEPDDSMRQKEGGEKAERKKEGWRERENGLAVLCLLWHVVCL